MYPDEDEIDMLLELVEALEIVEAGTRILCSRDMDLARADEVFEYILSELRRLNSSIAHRLELAVEERIHERRLMEASTLLAYLKDPGFIDRKTTKTGENKILPYANRKEITNLARDIHIRLFNNMADAQTRGATDTEGAQDNPEGNPSPGDHGDDPPSPESQADHAPPPKRSRSNEIWGILDKPKSTDNPVPTTTRGTTGSSLSTLVLNGLKNDMKIFEGKGTSHRPTRLAEIYRALLSVPPTSCEAEREEITQSNVIQWICLRIEHFKNTLYGLC